MMRFLPKGRLQNHLLRPPSPIPGKFQFAGAKKGRYFRTILILARDSVQDLNELKTFL